MYMTVIANDTNEEEDRTNPKNSLTLPLDTRFNNRTENSNQRCTNYQVFSYILL